MRRLAAVAAATLALAILGSAPAHSENTDGACRITGGNAALLADQILPDGSIAFRGVIIVYTRACGDGAKGVSATFAPVAGSPTSCSPTPLPRIDQTACTFHGSLAVGLEGTPVVVTATAFTSGTSNEHLHDRDTIAEFQDARVQPGVEQKTSQCVVMLPEDGGRFGCTLF
jgi:hypothetical protein